MKTLLRRFLKNILSERAYGHLRTLNKRGVFNTLRHNLDLEDSMSLSELGKSCMTDKCNSEHTFGGESYLDIYDSYLHDLRHKVDSVLEIGVRDGASLRMWKAYFPQAKICGIDIDPRCRESEEERVEVAIGDQSDTAFLTTCFGKGTMFDLIVDDGSHVNTLTVDSFNHLFYERLKPGGIYIIEDLQCSYMNLQSDYNVQETWPGMKYNRPEASFDNNREDMNAFFHKMIKSLDHREGQVLFVHFWSMTCVIKKLS